MEEFSIAKQVYRLSQADVCEIARNSVLQSGFSDDEKMHWLGSIDRWKNDILKTNVPNIRIRFRNKTWLEEWLVLKGESEVMDSLIQFTTQNLLSSPITRRISMLPTIPDIDSLPMTKQEELGEFIHDAPEKVRMMADGPPVIPMMKKKNNLKLPQSASNIPIEKALPMYVSGAVFGCIVAIAVMDIIRRRS